MITLRVENTAVLDALNRLRGRMRNLRPALTDIGEHLVETTKRRFDTSTGPDGQRWDPNTDVTLARYLARYKGSHTKTGALSAKGRARLAAKKPLIGETRSLSETIYKTVSADAVEVGSPMRYAAVQQFGAEMGEFGRYSQIVRVRKYGLNDFRGAAGTKKGFPIPWGDIPPRPFLGLSGDDERAILDILAGYLDAAQKP